MKNRSLMMALIWFANLFGAVSLWSQEFKPSKQIDSVVHTGPGGGSDIFARAIAEMMAKEKLLPQRMQVVNKPGGGPAVAGDVPADARAGSRNSSASTG